MNINKINKLAKLFVKALEKPIDEWLKCDDCGKPENQYHVKPFYCWECIQRRKEKGLPLTPKDKNNIPEGSNYVIISKGTFDEKKVSHLRKLAIYGSLEELFEFDNDKIYDLTIKGKPVTAKIHNTIGIIELQAMLKEFKDVGFELTGDIQVGQTLWDGRKEQWNLLDNLNDYLDYSDPPYFVDPSVKA